MNRKKIILKILFAALLISSYSKAQIPTDTLPLSYTLRVFEKDTLTPGDTLQVFGSDTLKDHCVICTGKVHTFIYAPYYTQFKRQWPFLAATTAIYAAGFILTAVNEHEPLTEAEIGTLHASQVNKFDRIATRQWHPPAGTASDSLLFAIGLLPVVFLSEHHTSVDILPLAIMAAEAYLFNYGVTTITKNLTKRIRPYAYNPDVSMEIKTGPSARESFFSGHVSQTAAATFLFANVLTDYHPTMKPGLRTSMWVFTASVPAVFSNLVLAITANVGGMQMVILTS